MLTGYLSTLPTDTLLSAGVLYSLKGGAYTPIGVTDGAPDFDASSEQAEIMFDNRAPSRLRGLTRVVGYQPLIKGTFKELGSSASGNQVVVLEPGETEAIASGTTTVTVKNASSYYAPGEYITDFRWIFERAGGGYACIYAPFAICRKWSAKGVDKKEAQIAFEIEAVGDPVNDFSTAPYVIELRSALPSTVPPPPANRAAFQVAFNAIDPNTQIEHDWEIGYGHTLTAGFKAAIADQVGGGTDGFVSLVPDQGTGGGMYYDPIHPAGWTFMDTGLTTFGSSKGVLANDLKQDHDWFAVEIGTWQGAGGFAHQSKIDDGSGGTASQLNIGDQVSAFPQWPNATGGPRTSDFFSIDRDYTGVMWRQNSNALAELQWGFGRDHRLWTPRSAALTSSRTWRFGGEPSNGVDVRGDRRKIFSGRGVLSKAHIKLITDYAVARLGVPERTRKIVQLTGNSIMTFFPGPVWDALGHSTNDVGDVAVAGATFDDMIGRLPRLDGLIYDDATRSRVILAVYEFTNQIRLVSYPNPAAAVSDTMAKYRTYVDQMLVKVPDAKVIWFTGLPIGGYADASYRDPFNALVRTEVTARGGSAAGHYLCDWAAHPIMGLTSALPSPYGTDGGSGVPNKYYIDNVHPSQPLGVNLLINDPSMLKAVINSIP